MFLMLWKTEWMLSNHFFLNEKVYRETPQWRREGKRGEIGINEGEREMWIQAKGRKIQRGRTHERTKFTVVFNTIQILFYVFTFIRFKKYVVER